MTAAWSSSTTYQVGQQVARYGADYQAIVQNVGYDPAISPSKWEVLGNSVNALTLGIPQSKVITFTETTGNGTYTGQVDLPAGAMLLDIIVFNTVVWNSSTSASLKIGTGADDDGYLTATDVKTTPAVGAVLSLAQGEMDGALAGDADPIYLAADTSIIAVITKVGTGANGRTFVVVLWCQPPAVVAAKA